MDKNLILENFEKAYQKKDYSAAEKVLLNGLDNLKDDIELLMKLAFLYQTQKKYQAALAKYQQLLHINPNNPDIYNNLGLMFSENFEFEKAVNIIEKALNQNIINKELLNTFARIKCYIGKFVEAEEIFKSLINNYPDYASPYVNLSNVFYSLNKFDQAQEILDLAIERNLMKNSALFNKSLSYFKSGNLPNAWDYYEYRKLKPEYPQIKFDYPELNTLDIKGKSILIYDEQGYGDTFQFLRFIKLLKNLGSRTILLTSKPLVKILTKQDYIDEVLDKDYFDEKTNFDYYISLLSIPKLFNISKETLPTFTPYIEIDSDLTISELISSKTKIGIVWKGRQPLDNYHRSSTLNEFESLFNLTGIQFVSLQKELKDDEKMFLKKFDVIDLSEKLESFYETAVCINQLDLVITIDTSVAHLAAAMGKKTFVMLSASYDWRWISLNNKTLWYPEVETFIQDKFLDWKNVFEEIKFEIMNINRSRNGIQSKHKY